MIRRCLIVDVETSGLDPATDKVIEVAAVLYSIEHRTALAQFSTLIPNDSNAAGKINRIPVAALAEMRLLDDPSGSIPIGKVMTTLRGYADIIVAHNAEFDRAFFKGDWLTMEWLCTMSDFSWPLASRESEKLVDLALDHGIGVSSSHRALTDCQLIAALFDRMHLYGCDLQEMFARAMRPKALFQSLQPFEDNQIAKDHGFQWNQPQPGREKKWTRRMAIEDAASLPFKTLLLQEVA